jgi:nucleotide-binding universal stress UspA family protein
MKTILVHLGGGPSLDRLRHARRLAERFGARLVGLFAERARAQVVGTVASWPSPAHVAAAEAARRLFETETAGLADREWRDADRGGDEEVTRAVVAAAHGADLVVLGKDRGGIDHDAVPAGLAERVVLESGRPCLVLPAGGPFPVPPRRALVAWNGSRGAVRALCDALPLLAGAEEVVLLTIGAIDGRVEADALRRFTDHGLPVRVESLPEGWLAVADLVLARAADNGADLLVMGGHEPGGLAWILRPDGARRALAETTLPLLMSH